MSWFIFIITLAALDALEVQGVRLADIYWNTSNPIFRIDNTDHIIDVNVNNLPFEYDQVNIICPSFPSGTNEDESEQYIIYNVSKEEYDSCRITTSNPRIIAVCDKPTKLMYFTITFRSFTPQPGGLEFKPGQDYYFISTSSGKKSGLRSLVGGKCGSNNMKIIFKVCCDKKSKVGGLKPSLAGHWPNGGDVSVATRPAYPTTRGPFGVPNSNNVDGQGQFIPPFKHLIPSSQEPTEDPRYQNRPRWPPRRRQPPHFNTGQVRDDHRWRPHHRPREPTVSDNSGNHVKNKNKVDRKKSPNDTRAKNELLKKNNATPGVPCVSSWLILSSTIILIVFNFRISR